MHPARGTTTATETAPARREAVGRAGTRRRRAMRLALAAATAGVLAALALVLPGGSTAGPVRVAASPVFATEAAAAHTPPSVAPMVAATKPKVTRHVRTPTVNLFTATPAKLPAAGGAVHLYAMVQRASSCTFSSSRPLGSLPATRSCTSGSISVALVVPKNTTASPRTFHFQVAVRGPYGPSSAGPVAVVEAAPTQASAPPRLTLEPASTSVTAGSSVTFTAAAAGPVTGVQWQLSSDGGNSWGRIDGADAASYSFIAVLAESGFRYRAVFASHGRSTTTSVAVLTVTAPAVAQSSSPQAVAQPAPPSAAAAADSAPQITEQPDDQGAVIGSPATFTAAASGVPTPTVQWQVSTDGGNTWAQIPGAQSASYTLGAVTSLDAGEYEAVFSNGVGTPATTAPATLTVSATPVGPQVTTQPSNMTVTTGSIATFTAAASGVPTPSVQWQIYENGAWTAAPCQTRDTCSFTADVTQNGDYLEATFSNSVGNATSDIAILTVNPADTKPAVQLQPSTQNVAAGDTASFTATASGIPTPTVQWEVSSDGGETWSIAPGLSANSTTYSFIATTGENDDEYQAVFTNALGSATSVPAGLAVAPSPPRITTQPVNQVVPSGSSATFTAAASGDPTPTVQWQINMNDGQGWGNIAGATSTSYTLNFVNAADGQYEYQAVFTNAAGSVTTDVVTVTIGVATATSQNWSGYVATSDSAKFTYVAGSWTVPFASCTGGGDFYSSDWVGIDGYPSGNSSVEQDGTDTDCVGSTPKYYAWYEMYPAASTDLPAGHPVSAGDEISASVSVSGTQWTLAIADSTAGWSFDEPATGSGLQQASAEWIAERPTVNGQYASLTDFGSVSFGGASATLGGQSGTIASLGGVALEMDGNSGALASPSSLGGSGSSFTDTWVASS